MTASKQNRPVIRGAQKTSSPVTDKARKPDPQVKIPSETVLGAAPKKRAEEITVVDNMPRLTRNEGAAMLKISVNTIANYEQRGKLKAEYQYRPDSRGVQHRVAVYALKDLLKIPHPPSAAAPAPGELAALCFELLDQGKTVREIVVEVRETPERVLALRDSWLDAGGADLVVTPAAKRAFEDLVGPFKSVPRLLALVTQKLLPGTEAAAAADADAMIADAAVDVAAQKAAANLADE